MKNCLLLLLLASITTGLNAAASEDNKVEIYTQPIPAIIARSSYRFSYQFTVDLDATTMAELKRLISEQAGLPEHEIRLFLMHKPFLHWMIR